MTPDHPRTPARRPPPRLPGRARWAGAVLVAGLALLAAGCGSSAPSDTGQLTIRTPDGTETALPQQYPALSCYPGGPQGVLLTLRFATKSLGQASLLLNTTSSSGDAAGKVRIHLIQSGPDGAWQATSGRYQVTRGSSRTAISGSLSDVTLHNGDRANDDLSLGGQWSCPVRPGVR